MTVCTKCGRDVGGDSYCDQCGEAIQRQEVARPTLLRPALYKCARCGTVLSNAEGTTFCDNCGMKFRLMTQCPNGHNLHDLAASFCSQCGERIAIERFPPLRLAPMERYGVVRPSDPPTRVPEPSPPNDGVISRLSGVYGSIRRHIQKPKVRILRSTTPQPRQPMYPQVMQPQMYPQMGQPMQYPNGMYPGFGMPQASPTVYPRGFYPPSRVVHPQGAQMQGWPFRQWDGRSQ